MKDHYQNTNSAPLHMIVTGTAGTGKSYLINCIRLLLQEQLNVSAPTGAAAFIIDGKTLHTLLSLPTKGGFKELEGNRLHTLQQLLSGVKYIIIDEMSMVGRKIFGEIDRCLRQVFPHHAQEVFGECSIQLFGDFGQLHPVMDLTLYTTDTHSDLSDQGRAAYLHFKPSLLPKSCVKQAKIPSKSISEIFFFDSEMQKSQSTTGSI